jgi:glycosyltransferase involved in cell wall biosynthesis
MQRFNLVTVAVPALNEAESLEELYERTAATMQRLGQDFEFLVVDDGSTDGTFDLLTRLKASHKEVRAICHAKRHGKSMALMQAFDAARGDVVVCLDADLQDQPEDIPLLLEKIAEGYDMAGGWRRERKDTSSKCFVSGVYNFLINRLCHCPVHDINCGLKAMTRKTFAGMDLRGDMHRIMPLLAMSRGLSFAEVPVGHAPRKHGQSRYRLLRHRGILDLFAFYAMQSTQLRPFHVFFEAGFVLFVLACLAFVAGTLGYFAGLRFLAFGLAGLGGLLVFVATMLPLFGFCLEVLTGHLKAEHWRHQLISRSL